MQYYKKQGIEKYALLPNFATGISELWHAVNASTLWFYATP